MSKHVVSVSLGSSTRDKAVTIELGGQSQDLPIATISRYWFGDFLLLWRPPLAVAKSLGPGMRGAEVRWLRDNLFSSPGNAVTTVVAAALALRLTLPDTAAAQAAGHPLSDYLEYWRLRLRLSDFRG